MVLHLRASVHCVQDGGLIAVQSRLLGFTAVAWSTWTVSWTGGSGLSVKDSLVTCCELVDSGKTVRCETSALWDVRCYGGHESTEVHSGLLEKS